MYLENLRIRAAALVFSIMIVQQLNVRVWGSRVVANAYSHTKFIRTDRSRNAVIQRLLGRNALSRGFYSPFLLAVRPETVWV